jgi:hypothetical protein
MNEIRIDFPVGESYYSAIGGESMNQPAGSSLEECALTLSQRLAESHALYTRLLALEREQEVFIEQGEIEETAARIDDKQALLSQIQTSDRNLHESNQAWQAVRDQAPGPLRERLQRQVEDLQKAISQILDLQKKNEDKLRQHGDEINRKLQEIRQKRTANRGYQQRAAQDAYGRSKFYDKRS